MTLQSSPKKVVVLALPGARELDLASVLDVFTQANCQLAPNPACFLYRPGNQAQFSVLLAAESAVSAPIRKLQTWFPDHLTEDLSVPALARRAGMSPRTFQRIFTLEIGKAPSLYVEELRIEAVRRKLELTSLRLSEIAEQCGFASCDVMTRRFRFHLKVKPLDYRTRFRSSTGPGKSLRKGHPPTKGSPKIPGRRQQGDVCSV